MLETLVMDSADHSVVFVGRFVPEWRIGSILSPTWSFLEDPVGNIPCADLPSRPYWIGSITVVFIHSCLRYWRASAALLRFFAKSFKIVSRRHSLTIHQVPRSSGHSIRLETKSCRTSWRKSTVKYDRTCVPTWRRTGKDFKHSFGLFVKDPPAELKWTKLLLTVNNEWVGCW